METSTFSQNGETDHILRFQLKQFKSRKSIYETTVIVSLLSLLIEEKTNKELYNCPYLRAWRDSLGHSSGRGTLAKSSAPPKLRDRSEGPRMLGI